MVRRLDVAGVNLGWAGGQISPIFGEYRFLREILIAFIAISGFLLSFFTKKDFQLFSLPALAILVSFIYYLLFFIFFYLIITITRTLVVRISGRLRPPHDAVASVKLLQSTWPSATYSTLTTRINSTGKVDFEGVLPFPTSYRHGTGTIRRVLKK